MSIDLDKIFMWRALALARRGSGFVSPNPMVGSVIVRDKKIVGYGWHQMAGGAHAEINALAMAGEKAKGSTVYVTLEPCNHFGKTPPCVDALIKAKVDRVVMAMRDPNKEVSGGGHERLKGAGIKVEVGILEAQAKELNIIWLHWIKTKTPFVLLKLASSLDGKIGYRGERKVLISSEISHAHVHRLRRYFDAVIIGSGTAKLDDPLLTNRSGKGKDPIRILVDSSLSVSHTAKMFAGTNKNIIFTANKSSPVIENFEFISHADLSGKVDLAECLKELGKRGIQSVICEGGSELATSLLQKRLCHRILIYLAPKFIGLNGVPMVNFKDDDFPKLKLLQVRRVGEDTRLIYDVTKAISTAG